MKVDRNIYPLFNFVAIFTFMYSATPRRGLRMCIADFCFPKQQNIYPTMAIYRSK